MLLLIIITAPTATANIHPSPTAVLHLLPRGCILSCRADIEAFSPPSTRVAASRLDSNLGQAISKNELKAEEVRATHHLTQISPTDQSRISPPSCYGQKQYDLQFFSSSIPSASISGCHKNPPFSDSLSLLSSAASCDIAQYGGKSRHRGITPCAKID